MNNIYLKEMTNKMYHEYYKEYQNDPDLYLDKGEFFEYVYTKEKVDQYIEKQKNLKRVCLAIMLDDCMIGEIKFYDLKNGCTNLGISLKNDKYKNRGFGTIAEKLAIYYAFNKLKMHTIFAHSVLTNTRSQHVLEKVGFKFYKQDEKYKYYKIERWVHLSIHIQS